jgi:hypothetical protein
MLGSVHAPLDSFVLDHMPQLVRDQREEQRSDSTLHDSQYHSLFTFEKGRTSIVNM